MFPILSAAVIAVLAATPFAFADIESELEEFHANPAAYMDKPLIKRGMNNEILPNASTLFSREDAASGSFVERKAKFRNGAGNIAAPICDEDGVCIDDVISGRAKAKDRVDLFLDLKEFRDKKIRPTASLEEMDALGLRAAKLAETPWSDSYWPISQGILGARYTENRYTKLGHNWKARFDLLVTPKESDHEILASGSQEELDSLSPSEKYDLLIGDLSGPYQAGYLTPAQWEEGQDYYKEAGKVETWMGICHGWAPASFMLPRPRNTVATPSADGKKQIKFYPSDLKGLASYIWAKSNVQSRFLGGRCNEKNPKKDKATGRILDENCFDTNPGNWHVATVNQIGLAKRSFVIDATYDYEVWNQPVYGYKYRYFNPQTRRRSESLEAAKIAIGEFTKDKFQKFRSKSTASVVGIEMELTYVVETNPSNATIDSAANDKTETVTYIYDLELNSKDQIIGGEWYSNKHPDFLWLPSANARAKAYGDGTIKEGWTPGEPLPAFWRDIAVRAATRYGQPLAAIVEPLLEEANR